MFKKYAKNLLDKEVLTPPSPLFSADSYAASLSPLPSEDREADPTLPLEEPETILGEKVCVEGFLSFETLLRIDGSFKGELLSEGTLIVGPQGRVKANIHHLKEAFISGKVEGDISVKERLVLRGKAEVRGNITAPILSVDEGVTIIGQVQVAAQKANPPTDLGNPC